MGLEAADYIWELVDSNPAGTDPVSQGANHLRMIKLCLLQTFPGMSAPWTTSEPINAGDPVAPNDLVTLQYLQAFSIALPIGWPLMWFLDALPVITGSEYGEFHGQALSRTTYANLFVMYGVTYGDGDGVTTFNLPDLRGNFLRVMDAGRGVDPDAAARTNRGDGTTGDNVGTNQDFAMEKMTGQIGGVRNYGGGPNGVIKDHGALAELTVGAGNFEKVSFDNSLTANTSTETRPVNINMRMILRLK